MSRYSIESKLPSVNASKDFLKDLETYLITKTQEISGLAENEVRKDYSVTITDSLGNNELASVTDYRFAHYPNDTKAMVFERLHSGLRWRITLEVVRSRFSMALERESAKEIIYGIHHELTRLCRRYGNQNWVFHNSVLQIVFALGFLLGLALLVGGWSTPARPFLLGLSIISIAFWITGAVFKPYCVFPTRRNETLQHNFKWFVMGSLSFLLYSVGGVWLRKSLLHF